MVIIFLCIYNVYKIVYVLVCVKSLCWNDVFVFFNKEIVIILVVFFSLFYWYYKYCIFWMFIFLFYCLKCKMYNFIVVKL